MIDRRFRVARMWSNRELRRIAPLLSGSVVNVSGWDDRDKEGGRYQDYFTAATSYAKTNYGGVRGTLSDHDMHLDLEEPLPEHFARAFDHVYNHTTLEHVFDLRIAFRNLCEMARQSVTIVVPFAQAEHYSDSFGDYWRFTPQALRKLFEQEGMTLAYCAVNTDRNAAIYVIGIGVRDTPAWAKRLPPTRLPDAAADWIGATHRTNAIQWLRNLLGQTASTPGIG